MSASIDPGMQVTDGDAAESGIFRSVSSNEFLDGLGPMRTQMGPLEYVPQSIRNLAGPPTSMRSLGGDSMYEGSTANGDLGPHQAGDVGSARHRRVASSSSTSSIPKRPPRLVAVRYFLDRPGYGMHNSAVRMWFEPPARCTPPQLLVFLKEQGIALDDLLVEVYLDKFQSFMLLEACEAAAIEWNFSDTSPDDPGVLNIRLTDVSYAARLDEDLRQSISSSQSGSHPSKPHQQQQQQSTVPPVHPHANTTPVGLFSFSIMLGLETAQVMGEMVPDFVSPQFVLTWGPYMFFAGGMLQIFTATLQVFRNNIYGAVAFFGFGSFWFSNGTRVMLQTHFPPPDIEQLLDEPDPWGSLVRSLYVLAFTMALLKQTFVMSKLSTTLIALLCGKIFCQALAGWSETMKWLQVGFGWVTSWFAFYVFLVEFTNQVYHREVFQTHKWSVEDSPEEVFGAAGQSQTLYSKAARLRQARFPTLSTTRAAMRHARHPSTTSRSAPGGVVASDLPNGGTTTPSDKLD